MYSAYLTLFISIFQNLGAIATRYSAIGRGARLCPYKLPRAYKISQSGGLFDEEHSYESDPFKRKFDNAPHEHGRILETFFYHFVKTGTFLDNLQYALLDEELSTKVWKTDD